MSLIEVSWLLLSIDCVGYMADVHVYVMFWITFNLNLLYYLCISQTYSHHHCEMERDNFLLFYRQTADELMTWIISSQCIDCNDLSRLPVTPKEFKYSESYWLLISDLEIKPRYIEPSIFLFRTQQLLSETYKNQHEILLE